MKRRAVLCSAVFAVIAGACANQRQTNAPAKHSKSASYLWGNERANADVWNRTESPIEASKIEGSNDYEHWYVVQPGGRIVFSSDEKSWPLTVTVRNADRIIALRYFLAIKGNPNEMQQWIVTEETFSLKEK